MLQSMYAIYENGFTYTDVISHIIGDVKLWESILYETERVMASILLKIIDVDLKNF